MFDGSQFNGDILQWNVSNVISMSVMFRRSKFNSDISKWNTSSVTTMNNMFYESEFKRAIPNWNVSNVIDLTDIFANCPFAQDISNWQLNAEVDVNELFKGNAHLLAVQLMSPLIVRLHLINSLVATDPVWAEAFEHVAPVAIGLGLTLDEHVLAIINMHTHLQTGVSLNLEVIESVGPLVFSN
jgi:surface protein